MSFQVGDIIQKSLPTGWKVYGTVLAIKRSFGYPDELTIKWQGEIQPDGDKFHYTPDFEGIPEGKIIFNGADLDYLQEQEFFCHG